MIRNLSLDTIRGIAILFVVISHFLTNSYVFNDDDITMLGNSSLNFSFFGNTGVILFFFLSGYLIIKSLNNTTSAVSFLIKRLLRIYPTYIFSICFVLIMPFIFDFYPSYNLSSVLSNVFFVNDFFNQIFINNVYWSLLVEIRFYFLIAIFYILSKKIKVIKIEHLLLLLLLLNFTKFFLTGTGSWLLTWLSVFFIGVFFYQYKDCEMSLNRFLFYGLTISISILIFRDFSSFLSMIICMLIFVLFISKDYTNKVLIFFGKISYSLYLLHVPIGYSMLYFMTKNISQEFVITKILITTVICIAISILSYKYTERLYYNYRGSIK